MKTLFACLLSLLLSGCATSHEPVSADTSLEHITVAEVPRPLICKTMHGPWPSKEWKNHELWPGPATVQCKPATRPAAAVPASNLRPSDVVSN